MSECYRCTIPERVKPYGWCHKPTCFLCRNENGFCSARCRDEHQREKERKREPSLFDKPQNQND